MKTLIIILYILLIHSAVAFAFETDQFNLPPVPLADIGDEVSEYTEENILKAIFKINGDISLIQKCLENNAVNKAKCGPRESLLKKLEYLRSEDAVAREVFKLLGDGIIPFTKSGSWMESHKFRGQPARYKTSFKESIFVFLPANYFTISPTVNLYGSEFGTDKIAHFFQQGYAYYKIYKQAAAQGLSANDASKKAVKWGKFTERTYYGTLVGGVYSNADLCANFVGMRFYQELTKASKVGVAERPAILALKNGSWMFNEDAKAKELLLKPYISDHLNEALNSSIYIPGLRSSIRGIVKKRSCPQWRALYPNLKKEDFENTTKSLMLWHEEDYGFKKSKKFITISNTCFAN